MATMNIDEAIARYIQLAEAKGKIERKIACELDPIKDEMAALAPFILAEFDRTDQQSVSRSGWTLFRQRQLNVRSACEGGNDEMVMRLRKARLNELVTANWTRLYSWVRETLYNDETGRWEVDEAEKRLPPSLRDAFALEEFYRLGIRKSQ